MVSKKNPGVKLIKGRKYDIAKEQVLSFRNKDFRAAILQISCCSDIREFAEFLMSGAIMDYFLLRGYGQVEYKNSQSERKVFCTTHEIADIVGGIEVGRFDPSEVLHDVAALIKIFPESRRAGNKEEIFNRARKLILKGYSVKVVDNSEKYKKLDREGHL